MAVPLSHYQFSTLVGLSGFREVAFVSNPATAHFDLFSSFHARVARYDVFWAHYEGNVYRLIHQFQPQLKAEYDLYSATRTVLSPAYRLGEFWSNHIIGGLLDKDAGDGATVPSCIPIVTKSPKEAELRKVLAMVFRASNWQAQKDNWTRFGAVLGDVGLMPFDDPGRQQVFLRVIHPRIVKDVDLDSQSNCKGYVFEEIRPDPRLDPLDAPQYVRYNEVASRRGGRVVYETFLDDEPFDWRDYPDDRARRVGPTWTEDYGFVPFVWHQHRNMGLGAGWSELHPSLSKMMELDDLASKVDDQARKLVDCPWFFSGTTATDLKVDYDKGTDDDDPDPVRSKIPIFCSSSPDARATPLVAPLDLKAASEHALQILAELERDHIELQSDMASASGTASGRALRVARERVEKMVTDRRAGYDDAQVRAYQMCVSLGAMKGYPGYEAFDAGSFARGELDMAIGDRPVFAVDQMDKLEQVNAQSLALVQLTNAGMPLYTAMDAVGFTKEQIAAAKAEQATAERKALAQVQKRMETAAQNNGPAAVGGNGKPDTQAVDQQGVAA